MRLYKCDKCGHRNYITREDLDRQRAELFSPDKGLGKPVRSFASTFSAVTVLMEMFFTKKP